MREIDYLINGKSVRIKPSDFSGGQGVGDYQFLIYNALAKIGVEKHFVDIEYGGRSGMSFGRATWEINGKKYRFECSVFSTMQKNLGAVATAIQDDVRHVLRGIKPLHATMSQYEALPSPEEIRASNPYASMDNTELKNLMKLYHPDGSKPDKEKYSKLREAYEMQRVDE